MNHDPRPHGRYRLIQSQSEFEDALWEAFAKIAESDCKEIVLSDMDFASWPLGQVMIVDALAAWAMPHRKMTVLAAHYDDVPLRHPRWVQWRRHWSHIVSCRVADAFDADKVPTMLLVPDTLVLRLIPGDSIRGSLSVDRGDIERAREQIDPLVQRSQEGFPASTIGL
jgi:hypothetical protein